MPQQECENTDRILALEGQTDRMEKKIGALRDDVVDHHERVNAIADRFEKQVEELKKLGMNRKARREQGS